MKNNEHITPKIGNVRVAHKCLCKPATEYGKAFCLLKCLFITSHYLVIKKYQSYRLKTNRISLPPASCKNELAGIPKSTQ